MYLFKIWVGEGSYLGFDAFVPFAFSKSIHTRLYIFQKRIKNLFLYLRLSFDWEQPKLALDL